MSPDQKLSAGAIALGVAAGVAWYFANGALESAKAELAAAKTEADRRALGNKITGIKAFGGLAALATVGGLGFAAISTLYR